jgi:signal transduction histidine kinase
MRLLRHIFFSLLLFFFSNSDAQDSALNVTELEGYREVAGALKVWQPPVENFPVADIPFARFGPNIPTDLNENNYYHRKWYLLELYYNGDEPVKTVYFYPGKMVNAPVFNYDDTGRSWRRVKEQAIFNAIPFSSRITLVKLTLKKGVTERFLFYPDLHYYNWTQWKPTIAGHTAANDLILQEFIQPNFTYSILTILMAGMMFMLFSYSILKFYLNRRSEYLYNSLFGFTFLLVFAIIFINNYFYQPWWHRYSSFFEKWLQILGYIFELIFIIRFLDLRTARHRHFLFLRGVIIGMMAYCCVLPFIAFSDALYSFNTLLFNIVSLLLLAIGLYCAVILHGWNKTHSRYVSYGLMALAFFLILIILQNTLLHHKQHLVQKIGGWIILYHAGVLTNLFFFRLGLGQKERREELKNLDDIEKLKLENEKKELEKVLGIASSRVDERNRIAKEIHDDIGSGLTSIRLLSEIALVKQNNKDELNKISSNANELVNNLNEIIWSINSKNDTIPNLLAYIRSHMVDYLEPYDLKLSINIPPDVPNVEISGEDRRNIFMVIKECFTNIAKHANATAVNFTVQVRDQLIFTIKDDGKGFNSRDILPFKNGIRNMKERIEHVGGEMDIWGKNGTTITIKIPLQRSAAHL